MGWFRIGPMSSIPANDFPALIAPLTEENVEAWVAANTATRGDSEVQNLSMLWHEARAGTRVILAAWNGTEFLGHVTMKWQSEYAGFRRKNIPEIVDLWVQPDFRRKGIARQLMYAIESRARAAQITALGLSVGVSENFKPAQKLYAQLGFRPDGSGLWRDGSMVDARVNGIDIDDEVVWMWVRNL